MSTEGIQESRIRYLGEKEELGEGDYVLYWMQQSQRSRYNHALEFAIDQANRLSRPLVVGFGITEDYPDANLRHYRFMLEGLQSLEEDLADRKIQFVARLGDPPAVALELSNNARLVVCDRGYLRHQRQWRERVSREAQTPLIQVESDAVVPVDVTSDKAEYAARTIRPKIHRHLEEYLSPLPEWDVEHSSLELDLEKLDLSSAEALLKDLEIDREVSAVTGFFRGGTREGEKKFQRFLENSLARYDENRNQPQTDHVSHISPYLHFGQISPLWLALEAQKKKEDAPEDVETFLEELIVRRELAVNFTEYKSNYDEYDCLPEWARKTLGEHREDEREFLYSLKELEEAETHDEYWNAAMLEMRETGFMHNYMRMYWGKKILEWSPSPEEAFETALTINNKYFLDGRDPNSFAGVAWIFGLHDRAWGEREIYGKVRYMAASGLERKCDIKAYVSKIQDRIEHPKN